MFLSVIAGPPTSPAAPARSTGLRLPSGHPISWGHHHHPARCSTASPIRCRCSTPTRAEIAHMTVHGSRAHEPGPQQPAHPRWRGGRSPSSSSTGSRRRAEHFWRCRTPGIFDPDADQHVGRGARRGRCLHRRHGPHAPADPATGPHHPYGRGAGLGAAHPADRVVLRRIVGARCLVSPTTERHLFTWRRLAGVVGADHKAVQRWHAQGIGLIVDSLNRPAAANGAPLSGPLPERPRARAAS